MTFSCYVIILFFIAMQFFSSQIFLAFCEFPFPTLSALFSGMYSLCPYHTLSKTWMILQHSQINGTSITVDTMQGQIAGSDASFQLTENGDHQSILDIFSKNRLTECRQ